MRLIEIIASGIGKVWSFLASVATICLVSAIGVFGLTIFMPDNVLQAIEIIKAIF